MPLFYLYGGKMKVLETEINFDFYDAEQMEKLEVNIDKIKKEINKINPEKMKQSQFINKFCSIIEEGFDSIFGEGSSKDIFKEKRNFKLCVQAFKDLVKARENQEKELVRDIQGLQKEIQNMSYNFSTERIK